MGIVTFREMRRSGARVLGIIAGVSGSGKTVTAMHLAYGLAGYDAAKVAFLDTEKKRGSMNEEALEAATRPTRARVRVADLPAPFSPARYCAAISDAEASGAEVLVIDSGSHEWEGFGGCEEIATAPGADGKEPKFPRWNLAKREHKRFMHALLQSNMHVVMCLRAREKVEVRDGGKTVRPIGIQPICEKNVMFEATFSVLLHDEGKRYDRVKVPGALQGLFPGTGYITADTGYAIRQWVDGGGEVDPHVEKWRNRLLSVTEKGQRYIETAWAKVPAEMQRALGDGFYSELEASAKEFDRQRQMSEEPEAIAEANRAVRGLPIEFGDAASK